MGSAPWEASVTNPAIAYLLKRLRDYGHHDVAWTADDTRASIIALWAAPCVAGRIPGAIGSEAKKLHTFASLWEAAWGQPFETRERRARRKA
jgi:hypothetical protein